MQWFEVDQIDEITYVISENQHWEKFNTYYLIGEKYNVVIDCGIGIYKIKEILKTIDDKPIKLFITHMHWDHIGNMEEFKEIYLSEKANYYLKKGYWEPIEEVQEKVIRDVDQKLLPDDFEVENYTIETSGRGNVVKDEDIFNLGNREIEVIETPGHTEDHLCFYDRTNKYLFAGDFIYKGPLFLERDYTDIDDYFDSLEKIINNYPDIKKILSSHYEPEISFNYLKEIYQFILKLKEEGKYKQGTKVHKNGKHKIFL